MMSLLCIKQVPTCVLRVSRPYCLSVGNVWALLRRPQCPVGLSIGSVAVHCPPCLMMVFLGCCHSRDFLDSKSLPLFSQLHDFCFEYWFWGWVCLVFVCYGFQNLLLSYLFFMVRYYHPLLNLFSQGVDFLYVNVLVVFVLVLCLRLVRAASMYMSQFPTVCAQQVKPFVFYSLVMFAQYNMVFRGFSIETRIQTLAYFPLSADKVHASMRISCPSLFPIFEY